jgi:hypothetical protein
MPSNVQLNAQSRDPLASNQPSAQPALPLDHPLSVPKGNPNSPVDFLPVSPADFLPSTSRDACQVESQLFGELRMD